ncbi:MAG: 5-bromo-4-chloroindolyl phosphate hydrolysis family protein [Eubacteriaceae bacterium]|nr:5-bromo-4-chloroindolyl phosphate hydrolysis family protein [Eubacteriaceae bacterium]
MEKKLQKSVIPIYAFGAAWLVYALMFPMYKGIHYLAALVFSVAVYFISGKICPPKEVLVEKALFGKTGNERVDNLLEEANSSIKNLRVLRSRITDQNVLAKLYSIEDVTMEILGQLIENPGEVSSVRRFINYYLPTTEKLVSAYCDLEDQKVGSENISVTMGKISQMLDTILAAFHKQYDSLFESTALDIGAEITVMQQILTSEGLLKPEAGEMKTDADNVADFNAQAEISGLTLSPELEKEKI